MRMTINNYLTSDELKELRGYILDDSSKFYGSNLYKKLFNHYSPEMPYGVAKYKTGDADVWILDRVESELFPLGLLDLDETDDCEERSF